MNSKLTQAAAPSLLTVSPSPHARRGATTASVMKDVLIALLPATVWGCYLFGLRAALVVLTCVVASVLFEALTQILLHRPVTIADCSAAVTGLLLGLNLSPAVPFYIPIVGSAFAIIVVKQIFGGIGKNVMNPALAARVFLMLAWTNGMTVFPAAYDRVGFGVDAVASATPLIALKDGALPTESLFDLFLGRVGGCIGEVSVLMLLIGGVYLLARRVIAWHIPVAFIGTVALLTFLFPQGGADRLPFMVASLCSGGLMLGAIFMATDYVTSPVTSVGRLIFGVGCGALVVFLRYFSGYNEGVSFAILIMNALVWYLDMATKPRVFGKKRREAKKGGA
ncbi:MAG: RnfABCDGE type electron transport complex subunit D [Ruminococcaceae bacterium]|nr:RnfABCDGE type electron transport complex subunit D [Oscillospiraceae bacterium]